MPYLTFVEYNELGFAVMDETEFDKLIKKASDVVDSTTRYFYKFNNLEDDIPFRREQFKKAVGSQVEYFHDVGATTSEGINSSPQSFSAGRTSVSNASRYKAGGSNEKKPLISDDVFMYLSETGLLYRGVTTW